LRSARRHGRAASGAPAAPSPATEGGAAPGLARALDAERRRIAADLHDRGGPNLATISMNLVLIEQRLAGRLEPELLALLAETRQLLSATVAELRDLSAELRPARLAYAGLLDALDERIEQFRQRNGTIVRWTANWRSAPPGLASDPFEGGPATPLSAEQEWILYRAVQEALVNCEKHARAGQVVIELRAQADRVELHIDDDGVGFEPQQLGTAGSDPGLGLLMMRERVEEAHGRFELASAPGQGTRIRIMLPLG